MTNDDRQHVRANLINFLARRAELDEERERVNQQIIAHRALLRFIEQRSDEPTSPTDPPATDSTPSGE